MDRIPRFLRWLTGGLIAIAVMTGLLLLKGPGQNQALIPYPSTLPQISSSPTIKPLHSVLIQVNDEKQRYVGGLLLVRTGDQVAIAHLDPHIAIDLRTLGQLDLRRASHEVTSPDMIHAINVASGLSIDAVLVLRDIGLAAFVDGIGGVRLNAPERTRVTAPGVLPVKYLPAGTHLTKGEIAAEYAIHSAPIDSPLVQQRLRQVVTAVLDNLPNSNQDIIQLLSALGQSGRSTVDSVNLAEFFQSTRGKWTSAAEISIPTFAFGNPKHKDWILFDIVTLHNQVATQHPNLIWNPNAPEMQDQYRIFVQGSMLNRGTVQSMLAQGSTYFIDSGHNLALAKSKFFVTASVPQEVIDEVRTKIGMPNLAITKVESLQSGADMQLDLGKDFQQTQSTNGQ